MAVIAPVVKPRKGKVSGKKPVMSWRKCPFCSTINKPSRKKCRNCGLKYPFKLEKEKSESHSRFPIILKDPRSIQEIKIEKILGFVIVLVIAIPYAIEYFFSQYGYFNRDSLDVIKKILPGLLPTAFAIFFALKSRNYAEQECKSCRQIMVVRVPRSRTMFPGAVECWNCGAIHDVVWDDGDKKTGYIPRAPQ